MRTALICLSEPDAFVDLPVAKRQLRISDSDTSKDAAIQSMLDAACGYLDGADGSLKRAVGKQTWKLVLPRFSTGPNNDGMTGRWRNADCHRIELPLPPIQSVTSVKYFDGTGTEQTLDPTTYRLVNRGTERSRLVPVDSWPSYYCREDAVNVTFVAGYGDADGLVALPKVIRQAVLLMVQSLYNLGERNVFVTGETVFGVGSKQFAVSDAAAVTMQKAVDHLLFNIRLTAA